MVIPVELGLDPGTPSTQTRPFTSASYSQSSRETSTARATHPSHAANGGPFGSTHEMNSLYAIDVAVEYGCRFMTINPST